MKRNFSNDSTPISMKSNGKVFQTTYFNSGKNQSNQLISLESNKNLTLSNLKMISKSELIRMIQNKNNQNNSTQSNLQSYTNFNKNNYMTKKADFNNINAKNDKNEKSTKILPSLHPNLILNNASINTNNNNLDDNSSTTNKKSLSSKKILGDNDFTKIKHKIVEKYRELSNAKNKSNTNLISLASNVSKS